MQKHSQSEGYIPMTHHTLPQIPALSLDATIAHEAGRLHIDTPRLKVGTWDEPKKAAPSVAVTPINPSHYRSHPSGIECIQITQHMGFNLGNAVKYIWRCDLKHDAIEDLKKAKWYIEKEIAKREAQTVAPR
ncbi:DUF3310 domain-containing protein [Burkholderia sp. HI2714]|uniref:DUF3310 domain-containing protein n=1 Tax=Burkholderia sp. HI2714 TaxID=2015359 RepID=UPI001C5282D4|nr:DUF3310 domain-containing protein [Burkholderia sp. HI2714]